MPSFNPLSDEAVSDFFGGSIPGIEIGLATVHGNRPYRASLSKKGIGAIYYSNTAQDDSATVAVPDRVTDFVARAPLKPYKIPVAARFIYLNARSANDDSIVEPFEAMSDMRVMAFKPYRNPRITPSLYASSLPQDNDAPIESPIRLADFILKNNYRAYKYPKNVFDTSIIINQPPQDLSAADEVWAHIWVIAFMPYAAPIRITRLYYLASGFGGFVPTPENTLEVMCLEEEKATPACLHDGSAQPACLDEESVFVAGLYSERVFCECH
jgi:hypothetical protein